MDSVELLAREEEFIKLNKQLEKKTESLMKQIENTLNKKDIFSDFSPSPTHATYSQTRPHSCSNTSSKYSSNESTPKKHIKTKTVKKTKPLNEESESETNLSTICCNCCVKTETQNVDLEFLQAFVSLNVQLKVLPESLSKDNVSVESVCKFLASKLQLMQEQRDKLQSELDRKASQCDTHLTQIAEYEGERLRTLNRCTNLQAQWTSMKNKLAIAEGKLDQKEKQYNEQRSEADRLKSELGKVKMANVKLEARNVTHSEEIDRLKQTIERMKIVEKDYREKTRELASSHSGAISRLEAAARRHRATIDKQSALIDNLRRQASLLSADAVLKCLDREYVQFLLKS